MNTFVFEVDYLLFLNSTRKNLTFSWFSLINFQVCFWFANSTNFSLHVTCTSFSPPPSLILSLPSPTLLDQQFNHYLSGKSKNLRNKLLTLFQSQLLLLYLYCTFTTFDPKICKKLSRKITTCINIKYNKRTFLLVCRHYIYEKKT